MPPRRSSSKPKPTTPHKRTPRTRAPEIEEAFALAYIANGGNATKAYLEIRPDVQRTTAAVEGSRLLRNPKVKRLVDDERAERFAVLEMQADEAVARISITARADIADAYDEGGKLLPVHAWPDSIRLAVRKVKPGAYGDEIELYSGLKAQELIAQIQGRLRNTLELKFDHAKYLGDAPPEE